jgi:methionyl aminopeptidase
LHYGKKGSGEEIVEGMFFTVEPMINENGYKTRRDELLRKKSEVLYEWTVITGDISIATGKRSLSAQFEHTIGIGKNGAEIFTKSPKQLDFPKS